MIMKTTIMNHTGNSNKTSSPKVPKTTLKPKPSKRQSSTGSISSSTASPSRNQTMFNSKGSKSALTKRITMNSPSGQKPAVAPLAPKAPIPNTTTLLPKTAQPNTTPVPSDDTAKKTRSVWYLGGNQMVKLLTSVEGDLDHAVLANIAEVPSVIGDLALSVESLVSDDITIGGFESDLLAKIASNTLAAKRTNNANGTTTLQVPATAPSQANEDSSNNKVEGNDPPPALNADGSVLDPLAYYDPVPNPLARITPPASPLLTMVDPHKRKDIPSAELPPAKMIKTR